MPWIPELFSATAVEHLHEKHRPVPYFDGLVAGEPDALIRSFAGEPELHHPIAGRVRGAAAFRHFVEQTNHWIADSHVEREAVGVILTDHRAVEEVVLHVDARGGRVELPIAVVADRRPDGRLLELRVYFSTWPLYGTHSRRPPLLHPTTNVEEADVVGEYQRALAAGDAEAVVDAFEPDAYAREPAGGEYVHRGHDGLREMFELFFSNGGGIPLEHCSATDDGRACALEYNVVRWGRTEMLPEAGVAVYVRGDSGKLAAARIYDDSEPPFEAGS
jgi:SnoaL-like domain